MTHLSRAARRGFLVGALLAASPLRAEPAAEPARFVRFRYTLGRGAERCPGEATLAGAVSARLGYDPFREDGPRSVTAGVRASGTGLEGVVTMRDAAGAVIGDRRLAAARDDCDELVAAMALAISVAVDPERAMRAQAGRAPPEAPPVPPLPVVPEPAPPSDASELPAPSLLAEPLPVVAEPHRPSGLDVHLGAGAVGAAGVIPGVAGGLVVEGGFRHRALEASLEAWTLLPARLAAPGGGSVAASLYAGSVVPCWRVTVIAACGLGTLGALRGSGAGVARPLQDVTAFAAAGLRLGVELPLPGILSASLHGDLSAPLTRTTLRLEGRDVWTSPRVFGALGALLRVHFR